MKFNIQSSVVKQAMGAVTGIVIATGLYVVVEYGSGQKALLIDTSTLSGAQKGTVAVNDKTIDAEKLSRITAQAQLIAKQMATDQGTAAIVATETDPAVQQRLQRRLMVSTYASIAQPSGADNPSYISAERAKAIVAERQQTATVSNPSPVTTTTVIAGDPLESGGRMHAGAPLAHTGLGTDVLMLLAFIAACAWTIYEPAKKRLLALADRSF